MNKAMAIVIAVNKAISEFTLNPDIDKTAKPATNAIVVVLNANHIFECVPSCVFRTKLFLSHTSQVFA